MSQRKHVTSDPCGLGQRLHLFQGLRRQSIIAFHCGAGQRLIEQCEDGVRAVWAVYVGQLIGASQFVE